MIKVVLFDLDGVLIKDPIFSTVYAAEFGIKQEDMLPFFSQEFIDCTSGEADLKNALRPYLKTWKWRGTVEELISYWLKHHQLIDVQILNLVKSVREQGIKVGLQTNQEKYRLHHIWNTLAFNKHFDYLYASCELKERKPHSGFFTKILQDLKPIESSEILFIDDSLHNIAVAKDFGFRTYFYANYEELKKFIETL